MPTDEQRVIELCDELLAKLDPKSTPSNEFLGAQYDLGLAWVHFPEGFGGLGLSPKLQNVINAKLFSAGAPIPRRLRAPRRGRRRRPMPAGRASPGPRSTAAAAPRRSSG